MTGVHKAITLTGNSRVLKSGQLSRWQVISSLNQNYNITIRTIGFTPISIRGNGMNIYTISEYLK